MAWVAVDKNGEEWIYNSEPNRCEETFAGMIGEGQLELQIGSIKKLIGRELTWCDEPVELK